MEILNAIFCFLYHCEISITQPNLNLVLDYDLYLHALQQQGSQKEKHSPLIMHTILRLYAVVSARLSMFRRQTQTRWQEAALFCKTAHRMRAHL